MAQTSGQLAGPMKWLVPRYPEEPGTIMVLGSIITDPYDLESSLNRRSGVTPIPKEDIRDNSNAVKRQIQSNLSSNSSVLFKAMPDLPLFGGGIAVGGRLTKGVETIVNALNVRAKVFIPTPEYMEIALENPEIKAFVKKGLFAKSLYIIVGVATTSQLTIKETQSVDAGGSVEGNLKPPNSGTELAVKIDHDQGGKSTSELEVKEDCDFAYRVREFQYSKIWRAFSDKGPLIHGTLFGRREPGSGGMGGNTGKDNGEDVPLFEYFEDDDISAKEAVVQELIVEPDC
jgi:hypothetical protein